MKKKLVAFMIMGAVMLSLTACDSGNQTGTVLPASESADAENAEEGTLEFTVGDDGSVILNAENAAIGMSAEGEITIEEGYSAIDIYEDLDYESEPCIEFSCYPKGTSPASSYYSYGSGSIHLEMDPGEYVITATVIEGTATGTLTFTEGDGSDFGTDYEQTRADSLEEFAAVYSGDEYEVSYRVASFSRDFSEDERDLTAAVVFLGDKYETDEKTAVFAKAVVYVLKADGDALTVSTVTPEFVLYEAEYEDGEETGSGISSIEEEWIDEGYCSLEDLCAEYPQALEGLENIQVKSETANDTLISLLNEYNSIYGYSFKTVNISGTDYAL